jgi:hypothetical protein
MDVLEKLWKNSSIKGIITGSINNILKDKRDNAVPSNEHTGQSKVETVTTRGHLN